MYPADKKGKKKKKNLIIFHVDRINQDVIMTPNEIT